MLLPPEAGVLSPAEDGMDVLLPPEAGVSSPAEDGMDVVKYAWINASFAFMRCNGHGFSKS